MDGVGDADTRRRWCVCLRRGRETRGASKDSGVSQWREAAVEKERGRERGFAADYDYFSAAGWRGEKDGLRWKKARR